MSNPISRKVYTVSQLNKESKSLLEKSLGLIWLEGEISTLSMPGSGHWYFTLKDDRALVKAAMFKNTNRFVKFVPETGMKVLVRTKVSLFEPRGDYQLIIEYIEPSGQGALQIAFEQLKEKLAKEGLFSQDRKKSIPRFIKTLGIITSPTGAAIHDILHVIHRRFPSMKIIIYPSLVQGEKAADSLSRALELAVKHNACDTLLLTRGGGSLEDLWCFNDEQLARSIAQCPVPTVSAVGHEIDFTIADFIADLRAPTPSAAAEILSPDAVKLKQQLTDMRSRLAYLIRSNIEFSSQRVDQLSSRLHHPKKKIEKFRQQLDQYLNRMHTALYRSQKDTTSKLVYWLQRLQLNKPDKKIALQKQLLMQQKERLISRQMQQINRAKEQLSVCSAKLHQLSPLAILSRGYAVAFDSSKQLIKSVDQLKPLDLVTVRLHDGEIEATVQNTKK